MKLSKEQIEHEKNAARSNYWLEQTYHYFHHYVLDEKMSPEKALDKARDVVNFWKEFADREYVEPPMIEAPEISFGGMMGGGFNPETIIEEIVPHIPKLLEEIKKHKAKEEDLENTVDYIISDVEIALVIENLLNEVKRIPRLKGSIVVMAAQDMLNKLRGETNTNGEQIQA